jgi:hypothetical protein
MRESLSRILPKSRLGWVHLATTALSWLVILGMIGFVLAPTLGDLRTVGGHDWDQMESHRYLVTKTILRFHQFPFWNPYSCGGHPVWGGFETATVVVSPWFPFYMTMTLAHALRVEIFGSALISAAGTWLLAGRFTRSPMARAFVVVAFAVNGRWALQITAGHTWHLVYAWMPWALYLFDRAIGADATRGVPRRRDLVLTALVLALMVYGGGIYPLPHAAAVMALYSAFLAVQLRSFRPILVCAATGLLAVGLSAAKLFPIVEVLLRFPRLVDSPETMDLTTFVHSLTSHDQDMNSRPANTSHWGWHEWGMYVGWAVVVIVTIGCLWGRGLRESPLKWVGLIALILGFGSFDPYAPWPLLRHLPVFKSQHVPSRWMYPALLLLLVVTASVLERMLRRAGPVRAWLEIAMVPAVAWLAYDIASVARQPMAHTFANQMPAVTESTGPFRTEVHIPPEMNYAPDWAPPSLPAEMANIGTIDCGTFPMFHNYVRDRNGRAPGLGAHGRGDPAYKGEAFIADGVGQATISSFAPNAIEVEVTGAQPGEHVVLNQNWDGGWTADGMPAMNWSDTVATQLHAPTARITFRYRPRSFVAGLVCALATLAGIVFVSRFTRRYPLNAART